MKNNNFEKTMENVRKQIDVILDGTERRRNYLVSKPNFHNTKLFYSRFVSNRNKKTEILKHKSVSLGFSKLELSKTLMYEF